MSPMNPHQSLWTLAAVESAVREGVMDVVESERKAVSKGCAPYTPIFRAMLTQERINRALCDAMHQPIQSVTVTQPVSTP